MYEYSQGKSGIYERAEHSCKLVCAFQATILSTFETQEQIEWAEVYLNN